MENLAVEIRDLRDDALDDEMALAGARVARIQVAEGVALVIGEIDVILHARLAQDAGIAVGHALQMSNVISVRAPIVLRLTLPTHPWPEAPS